MPANPSGNPIHLTIHMGDLWGTWNLEPGLIALLILSAFLYYRGASRFRSRTPAISGIRRKRAICFAAGWLVMVIALVSPLNAMGWYLLSARMAQHELLALIAAPMLAFGRPLAAFSRALFVKRRRSGGGVARAGAWILSRMLTCPFASRPFAPFATWLIHATVLWLWHAPVFFQVALESGLAGAAQRLSLLVSAFIFCDALIRSRERASIRERTGRRERWESSALFYVFLAWANTTMLSFLMAKASTAWYPADEATAAVLAVWGRAPLDEQRLGSLIMWGTATPIYMIAWLIPLLAWRRKSERKVPAEQDVLLLDSDLWNSSEWRETYRDQA